MSDRMPTDIFVSANIRKCQSMNIPVYVQNKGDLSSGVIMLKVLDSDFKCSLFSQMRDMDGELKWYDRAKGQKLEEREADEQIKAALQRDPDLWVIEVETRDGENPFDGEVMTL
jgi:hypothetical protein